MTTVSYRTRGLLVSRFCLVLVSAISISVAMPLAVKVAAETGAAPAAELERGREALLVWNTPEPGPAAKNTPSPADGLSGESDEAEADRP